MTRTPHEAIEAGLRIIVEPASVFELRLLNTSKGTVSGYYDDAGLAARHVANWDGRANIYISLNRVDPSLLARSANALTLYAKHTTADSDILRRRWLPLDFDPVRKSGISSTDAEHEQAIERARAAREWLLGEGWPPPLMADSGNGAHLLCRVDLPNDEASTQLIEKVIQAISARFTDDGVSLDRKVGNPARIWKLYGTLAVKGSSTSERPHRRAAILEGSMTSVVPISKLLAVAAMAPQPPAPRTAYSGSGAPLDVRAKLAEWGVPILREEPRNGANMFVLARCPFDAGHGPGESAVFQNGDGLVTFACFHDSCTGRTWGDLRGQFEPGYRDRRLTTPAGNGHQPAVMVGDVVEWEPPVPFTCYGVPPFPVDGLPDTMRDYVSDIAACTQVPADLPAMIGLAVNGTASARTCDIRVGGTHAEPLNVWTVVFADPAARKSHTVEICTHALREFERELVQAMAPRMAEAKERRHVEEKRLAILRDQAARAKTAERDAIQSELLALSSGLTEEVAAPRILADDVTPERLAAMLADQGGGLGIFSPEGGIFGILAGRYGDKVNLETHLKAHAGDEIRVDRVGRPALFIKRPMLSMGLAVQPDVLRSLAVTPEFRGRGLLGRNLYSLPPSLAGTRLYRNREPDVVARRTYEQAISRILHLPPVSGNREESHLRHHLELNGEGLEVWSEYADAIERRQSDGSDLAGIRDWAGKLAGAVARIAGGFHLLEHSASDAPWTIPVDAKTILRAWSIGEYLVPHALAAFGEMGADANQVLAKRILAWIERNRLERFSVRDCHQHHREVTPTVLQSAIELAGHGYIRPAETPRRDGAGRKPGPRYDTNPLIGSNYSKCSE